MNRRRFIGFLATTSVAVKLAPLAKLTAPPFYRTYIMGEYADFNSVYENIVNTVVDQIVERAMSELAFRYSVTLNTLAETALRRM